MQVQQYSSDTIVKYSIITQVQILAVVQYVTQLQKNYSLINVGIGGTLFAQKLPSSCRPCPLYTTKYDRVVSSFRLKIIAFFLTTVLRQHFGNRCNKINLIKPFSITQRVLRRSDFYYSSKMYFVCVHKNNYYRYHLKNCVPKNRKVK